MFGILRTTLALMVMAYHLYIGIAPLGTYAVFGFYIISGYLMTLVMHDSYSFSFAGRLSFSVNRFLRLYPQYWAAAALSITLIYFIGHDMVNNYHYSMSLPDRLLETLQNMFMAFPAWYPNDVTPRLVPPTWALTVEIFFYMLIALGISKTFKRVKIWLTLSIFYVIGSYIVGLPWEDRYFPVTAASLPFAMGSAIYFASKNGLLNSLLLKLNLSSLQYFILMLLNCFVWIILTELGIGYLTDIGFYLNLIICSLLLFSIINGNEIIKINKKVDKLIGDFSYPIYLLHWQCGLIASYSIYGEGIHEFTTKGLISLIVALIIVLVLSFTFINLIDKPIQIIRSKIKANQSIKVIPQISQSKI